MIVNYRLELEKQYMPYAIFDDKGVIIGFEENTPTNAKNAAKEHILMSKKFDDVSNYDYYDSLLKKLNLD